MNEFKVIYVFLVEPLYCLIQLKSATEENASELCSAIFLRPGSGDYHDL